MKCPRFLFAFLRRFKKYSFITMRDKVADVINGKLSRKAPLIGDLAGIIFCPLFGFLISVPIFYSLYIGTVTIILGISYILISLTVDAIYMDLFEEQP